MGQVEETRHIQKQYRGKVADAGRIVIPAAYRKQFGIAEGDEVLITRSDYGIQITPLRQAVRRAQEVVAQYIPADADLVAELRAFRDQDSSRD
jgi:AbrB family looped-hinge helix DNA binding protein